MESSKETGCQAPEGPILCVNNCGFFGSAATMNMCSKCNKDMIKVGPNRCNTCRNRVGLTGFRCRCGNIFCADHRYSDKHKCPFDYRTAAKDAIARANPVVKAEKLDKI